MPSSTYVVIHNLWFSGVVGKEWFQLWQNCKTSPNMDFNWFQSLWVNNFKPDSVDKWFGWIIGGIVNRSINVWRGANTETFVSLLKTKYCEVIVDDITANDNMVMMARRLSVTTSGEERGSVAAPCIISSDPVEELVEESLSTKSSLHLGLLAASSCPK